MGGQLRKTTDIVTISGNGLTVPAGYILNTSDKCLSDCRHLTSTRLYHLHVLCKPSQVDADAMDSSVMDTQCSPCHVILKAFTGPRGYRCACLRHTAQVAVTLRKGSVFTRNKQRHRVVCSEASDAVYRIRPRARNYSKSCRHWQLL
jgi:hypothetical protein